MSDAPQAHPQAPSTRNSLFYSYVFGGLAVLTLIIGFVIFRFTQPSVPDKPTNTSAPPQAMAQRVEKVGEERKLYNFGDDGCTEEIRLRSDASFYPKGPYGENNWVTITPPRPAQPWDDAPGIVNKEEGASKPPGLYRVCRKNSSSHATGVEIWN